MNRKDLIVLDQLSHKSIVDACHLSQAELIYFQHNDMEVLESILATQADKNKRTLIISEGIFSMDGDIGPLPELIALKERYNCFLMIDDAHAFGTLGPNGRGSCDYHGIDPKSVDIWTGALSKSVPSNGGFVAGSQEYIYFLQHGASPYIFSGALSPVNVAVARAALRIFKEEPHRLEQLRKNELQLRNGLKALGYDTGSSASQVIPVLLPKDDQVCELAAGLFAKKILASAVVFPAVPIGKGRLRLCANAAYSSDKIDQFLHSMEGLKPSS